MSSVQGLSVLAVIIDTQVSLRLLTIVTGFNKSHSAQFQKMSISSSWKVIGNCKRWGKGALNRNILRGKYAAELEFPEAWGRVLAKTPYARVVSGYFQEQHS